MKFFDFSLFLDVCVRIRLEQKGKSQLKQSRIIKGTCCAVYKEAVMFLISPKLNDLYDTNITITVHDLSRLAFSIFFN